MMSTSSGLTPEREALLRSAQQEASRCRNACRIVEQARTDCEDRIVQNKKRGRWCFCGAVASFAMLAHPAVAATFIFVPIVGMTVASMFYANARLVEDTSLHLLQSQRSFERLTADVDRRVARIGNARAISFNVDLESALLLESIHDRSRLAHNLPYYDRMNLVAAVSE